MPVNFGDISSLDIPSRIDCFDGAQWGCKKGARLPDIIHQLTNGWILRAFCPRLG